MFNADVPSRLLRPTTGSRPRWRPGWLGLALALVGVAGLRRDPARRGRGSGALLLVVVAVVGVARRAAARLVARHPARGGRAPRRARLPGALRPRRRRRRGAVGRRAATPRAARSWPAAHCVVLRLRDGRTTTIPLEVARRGRARRSPATCTRGWSARGAAALTGGLIGRAVQRCLVTCPRCRSQEASPSPVYGARLLSGLRLIPLAGSNPAASATLRGPRRARGGGRGTPRSRCARGPRSVAIS